MEERRLEDQIDRIAALQEPVRRSLYLYVARSGREVGRDEAAREVKISRALAAFHLDRLVDDGLLEATFRRLSGKVGPGAGRPAKLYRRSERQIEITLPQRRYEMAAQLLARAVDEAGTGPVAPVLARMAGELGATIGAEVRRRAGERAGRDALLDRALEVLAEYGFEPVVTPDGEVFLRNCPFDALAKEHRALVCGMNLSILRGLVSAIGIEGVTPRLDPKPGFCCVVIDIGGTPESRRVQP
ncbi:MAG: transcriptional regulator [Candidatus Eisenbacteria bacterium]|nr:transcriptional regulator [Candidatus Eisenbacteria bacterium]